MRLRDGELASQQARTSRLAVVLLSLLTVGAAGCGLFQNGGGGGGDAGRDGNGGGNSTDRLDWMRLYGGETAQATDIARGDAGGIYVAGLAEGDFDGNTTSGNSDALVAKYNTSGKRKWLKLLGTQAPDRATGISVASSGAVYVVGDTKGELQGEDYAGAGDAFVAKFDSSGERGWVRVLGTQHTERASGVDVGEDGNIHVVGPTTGALEGTNAGGFDAYLTELTSDNTLVRSFQFGSGADDTAEEVAVDASGATFLVGYTKGGLGGNSNSGRNDAFVAKVSTSDELAWTELLGSSGGDRAYSVALGDSGGVYLTGFGAGDIGDASNSGVRDILVAKFSSSGDRRWVRLRGGSADQIGRGIGVGSSGELFVTGWTREGLGGESHGSGFDVFVSELDTSGARNWVQLLDDSDKELGKGVARGGQQGAYVCGQTAGDLGGRSNGGTTNGFVARFE